MKREVVGERIAEEQRTERHGAGNAHSAEENLGVEGIREQFLVIVEIPMVDDRAVLYCPEAVGKHQRVRQEEKKSDPEKWRGGDDRFVSA
jgi:hypothetical protein